MSQRDMDSHLISYKYTLITHVNGFLAWIKTCKHCFGALAYDFSIKGLFHFGEASFGFMFHYWG